jgi:hypothetical protein
VPTTMVNLLPPSKIRPLLLYSTAGERLHETPSTSSTSCATRLNPRPPEHQQFWPASSPIRHVRIEPEKGTN